MAKQKSSASSEQSTQSTKSDRGAQASDPADAIALLKTDHRTVLEAFKKYESLRSKQEKQELVRTICNDLIVHTKIEEEIFYPACRETGGPKEALDEAQVEHDGAKVLIGELLSEPIESEFYDAKVRVLAEYIRHHVGEEEKSGDGIFAKAQAGGVDLKTLGQRLQSRKQELTAQVTPRIGREDFRALELGFASTTTSEERQSMARYDQDRQGDNFRGRYRGGRDRDEYGRFRGEEDRYYGQGSGRDDYEDDRRYSRGQYGEDERDRDEFGRFTGGQDDDRLGYGQGRGYNRDEDQQRSQWRGSEGSRGYGGSLGQGRGGERGFEDRGDERGFPRYRGRDYDEEDQNYGSNRGGGEGRGWYGDPEGHSRAAERGWEDRGYGSRSRGGREEYERQGQRGNQNRGRESEHGGWFGDSRGHSEAARRGWQNR